MIDEGGAGGVAADTPSCKWIRGSGNAVHGDDLAIEDDCVCGRGVIKRSGALSVAFGRRNLILWLPTVQFCPQVAYDTEKEPR